jgi:glycosyltransferase involved in cell wall biosynthesis
MTTPEPLRLLLVQGAPLPGVAERALWELAVRLPRSRYALSAWLSPESQLDELALSLEQHEVAVERIAEPPRGLDLKSRIRVWQALRRHRPGLIHLHLGDSPAWHELPMLARVAGAPPLVVSQHGLPGPGPWSAIRGASVATVNCAATGEELVRDHAVPRNRLQVVPGGADMPDDEEEQALAARYRMRYSVGTFRPLWVCAGRIEDPKGHDVLLEALEMLMERGLDFVVAIAGEGSRRAALERRAAERGLAAQVHFLGAVEPLGPLLLAANAVMLPAREEALPLCLLEAMARGRPVVASNVGGIPDVVEDGIHGMLVPRGNAETLGQALAYLHGKQDLGRQMGMRGRERVIDGFTWDHLIERFEAIYDEVLGLAGFTPSLASGRPGLSARSRG